MKPGVAVQPDRITGMTGFDTVELDIIPSGAEPCRAPSHSFWIRDRTLSIVEAIKTERGSTTRTWLAPSTGLRMSAQNLIGWEPILSPAHLNHAERPPPPEGRTPRRWPPNIARQHYQAAGCQWRMPGWCHRPRTVIRGGLEQYAGVGR